MAAAGWPAIAGFSERAPGGMMRFPSRSQAKCTFASRRISSSLSAAITSCHARGRLRTRLLETGGHPDNGPTKSTRSSGTGGVDGAIGVAREGVSSCSGGQRALASGGILRQWPPTIRDAGARAAARSAGASRSACRVRRNRKAPGRGTASRWRRSVPRTFSPGSMFVR